MSRQMQEISLLGKLGKLTSTAAKLYREFGTQPLKEKSICLKFLTFFRNILVHKPADSEKNHCSAKEKKSGVNLLYCGCDMSPIK